MEITFAIDNPELVRIYITNPVTGETKEVNPNQLGTQPGTPVYQRNPVQEHTERQNRNLGLQVAELEEELAEVKEERDKIELDCANLEARLREVT